MLRGQGKCGINTAVTSAVLARMQSDHATIGHGMTQKPNNEVNHHHDCLDHVCFANVFFVVFTLGLLFIIKETVTILFHVHIFQYSLICMLRDKNDVPHYRLASVISVFTLFNNYLIMTCGCYHTIGRSITRLFCFQLRAKTNYHEMIFSLICL